MAGQETQKLAAERGVARPAGVLAEQLEPVGLVAALGFGQCEQDVALFAAAVLGQVTVDGGFGPFVGEVLAPALDVRGTGCRGGDCGGGAAVAGGAAAVLVGVVLVRFGVLKHESSWA